jgi:hypothetical protein
MKIRGIWTKTAVLFATSLLATIATAAGTDAPAAFAKLKSLAGEWEAKMSDGSKSRVQYEVISGGSAVLERFVNDKMGSENAMVTAYYLDGGRLLLQHYCMAKNQPRMQAEAFDSTTGELRFTFMDATGLNNPGDGHMHNASFRFTDADHMNQAWEFFESGKPKFTESVHYTRLR